MGALRSEKAGSGEEEGEMREDEGIRTSKAPRIRSKVPAGWPAGETLGVLLQRVSMARRGRSAAAHAERAAAPGSQLAPCDVPYRAVPSGVCTTGARCEDVQS